MNAKDKKIVQSNPGKSVYELIKLGLSQAGADELSQQLGQLSPKVQPPPTPEVVPSDQLIPSKVQPTTVHVARPELSPQLPNQTNDGMVKVLNKANGRIKPMTRTAAEMLARKTPHQYQIVG